MAVLTLLVCFVVLLGAAYDHGILHVSAEPAKLSLTWKDGDAVRTSELHLSRDHPVDTLSSAYRICNELGIGIGNVEKVAETIESAINGQQTATGDGHSRTRLLSVLVETFSLKHYPEIGCRDDHNFAPMKALGLEHTTCVDPNEGGTHRMTSDKFFQQNQEEFDLVFVDGMHEANQALRDVNNALRFLKPGGFIVMHDCNPATEDAAVFPYGGTSEGIGNWNGDVWRAVVALRTRPDLDVIVGDFDQGCAVVRRATNRNPLHPYFLSLGLCYTDLRQHRRFLLNLHPFSGVVAWLQDTGGKGQGSEDTDHSSFEGDGTLNWTPEQELPKTYKKREVDLQTPEIIFELPVLVDGHERHLRWSSTPGGNPKLKESAKEFATMHALVPKVSNGPSDNQTGSLIIGQLHARMLEVQAQSRLAQFLANYNPPLINPTNT
jgi:SAM-dependent methyltransferase